MKTKHILYAVGGVAVAAVAWWYFCRRGGSGGFFGKNIATGEAAGLAPGSGQSSMAGGNNIRSQPTPGVTPPTPVATTT